MTRCNNTKDSVATILYYNSSSFQIVKHEIAFESTLKPYIIYIYHQNIIRIKNFFFQEKCFHIEKNIIFAAVIWMNSPLDQRKCILRFSL